jgi:hypothetical protein
MSSTQSLKQLLRSRYNYKIEKVTSFSFSAKKRMAGF